MLEDICQTQSSSMPSLFASKKVQEARKELWNSLLSIYEQEATFVLSDDGIVVADLEEKAINLTNECLATSQLISEPKLPNSTHIKKVKNGGNQVSLQDIKVKRIKSVSEVKRKVERKRRSISKQMTNKKTNKSGKENSPNIISKQTTSKKTNKSGKENRPKIISKQTSKKTNKSGKENSLKIISMTCKKSNVSTRIGNVDKRTFLAEKNTTPVNMSSDFINRNNKRVFVFAGSGLVANICSCGFISNDFIF